MFNVNILVLFLDSFTSASTPQRTHLLQVKKLCTVVIPPVNNAIVGSVDLCVSECCYCHDSVVIVVLNLSVVWKMLSISEPVKGEANSALVHGTIYLYRSYPRNSHLLLSDDFLF